MYYTLFNGKDKSCAEDFITENVMYAYVKSVKSKTEFKYL